MKNNKLRVITGTAKGCKLDCPPDARPMTDRAKSALFAVLADDIKDKRILDLFAGSGSLGIEALSRGAKTATFVDDSREATIIIKQNLFKSKLLEKAQIFNRRASQFITIQEPNSFDIVFLDPPYDFYNQGKKKITKFLLRLIPLIPAGGAIILKHPPELDISQLDESLIVADKRSFGKNSITIWVKIK